MPVWITTHSAADCQAEGEKVDLDRRSLEGALLRRFEDGFSILVTHDTSDAFKLVERLVAVRMAEAGR